MADAISRELTLLTRMLIATILTYYVLTLPNAVYYVTSNHIHSYYSSYDEYTGAVRLWWIISK